MLMNYIETGSKTKVSQIFYSYKHKIFNINIETTDQYDNIFDSKTIDISGSTKCGVVNEIITTDEQMLNFMNTLETNLSDTVYLIKFPDDYNGDYVAWNDLVIKNNNHFVEHMNFNYIFIVNEQKYYELEFKTRKWIVPRIPQCDKFFEEKFGLAAQASHGNVIKMAYEALKLLPEFSNCTSDE